MNTIYKLIALYNRFSFFKSRYRNTTVCNKTVVMDGSVMVNSTFVGCELVFLGGGFTMNSCKFDGCSYTFDGAAGRTLYLLKTLRRMEGGNDLFEKTFEE